MKRRFLSLLAFSVCFSFFVSCASEADSGSTDTPGTEAVESTPDAKTPATPEAAEPDAPKTTVNFENTTHDFGNIKEGDVVNHVFKFKNTGDEPLIISSAKGSCGCTVPEWPKEPIPPGADSEIKVQFNSKGKKNKQTKTVTINANTDPNPTRLTIKAEVEPATASK